MKIINRLIGIKDHIQVVFVIIVGSIVIARLAITGGKYHVLFQVVVMFFIAREINNYFYKIRTSKTGEGDE